jgi:PAS domain S-box-containing protein
MIKNNVFNINSERGFEISKEDIPLFLDIIPFPCIIIDFKSRTILSINGFVTELTNYGRQELVDLDIFSLFEKFPIEKLADGKIFEGSIKIKGKSALPVSCEMLYLSQKQNTAIIKILSGNEGAEKQISPEKKIIESLNLLMKMAFLGNENGFYKGLLTEIPELFNFSKAYIYLFDDQEKLLKIIENDDDVFPPRMPSIEMERIRNIDLWGPGKRVLTEVHRIGRKNKLSTVITVPLGNQPLGMLVAVSEIRTINVKLQQEFEIYIGWINQFLDHINVLHTNNKEKNHLLNKNLVFLRFFEQSNDCFVTVNRQNKIISTNEQFQKLMKYSSYELVGQNFLDVIQSDKVRKIFEHENINPIVEISPVNVHDRDGNRVPVKMKVIRADGIEIDNKFIIFSNISEKIEAQETIEKIGNQAALGEVIADFAHEVRNPINNISTGLQLLRKKSEGIESSLEIIDRLQSDCVRMNDLMESILSFSRQNISNFKPLNCLELLERINNRFSSKYQKYKITPILICNSKRTIISGDIRSLDQVFTNLVNNAVDAMLKTGGELTIKINENMDMHDFLEVIISDTGRGIPESLKEKIFDPFITGKEKGTGLGLAITKRIIEAHSGRITVESFTNGTIFTVLLKLADEE